MAVPFDARRVEVTGNPKLLVENVARSRFGAPQFSFSDVGPLLYLKPSPNTKQNAASYGWIGRVRSSRCGLLHAPISIRHCRRTATVWRYISKMRPRISGYDLRQDSWTRLTFGGFNGQPIWTRDGNPSRTHRIVMARLICFQTCRCQWTGSPPHHEWYGPEATVMVARRTSLNLCRRWADHRRRRSDASRQQNGTSPREPRRRKRSHTFSGRPMAGLCLL